jgi:predicted MPP superfamily phosphohydrolase
MRKGQSRLVQWLRGLPGELGEAPDMVLATGDLIEDNSGIDPVVEVLASLESLYGNFYVLGSHDYYQSKFQAYTKYITGRRPIRAPKADTTRLEAGLTEAGWKAVTNSTEVVETDGGRVRVVGVDDPYIHRDRTEHIRRGDGDTLALGLVHAPDVVSDYALHGFDLVVAGHTHAGQVRVPGLGAIVTNCTLPSALAGGLSRVGSTWLHVSPGLGSGRFAPIRFNCRPEATLLTFQPAA